jgi:glycosyltransferase involved in cell wall biosynthesis
VRGVLQTGASSAGQPEETSLDVLTSLIETVKRHDDVTAAAWLLVVGLCGAYPEPALVQSTRRAVVFKAPDDAALWLLDAAMPLALLHGSAQARLRVVTDRPLVDVDFTAKKDVVTGIQRVVRGVMSVWADRHEIESVAWTARGGAYRALHDRERQRLEPGDAGESDETIQPEPADVSEIVVPWGVPVVLIEVPPGSLSDRLAAVAELTHNPVRLVGHDCLPVSSAETVSLSEPEKFGHFLELVKHADRVAGVSRSAAAEFQGFARALSAQGLLGPRVVACPLPHTERLAGDGLDAPKGGHPLVVCFGSVGRRKNQVALLEAAELLWREGLDFEVRILGHISPERSPFRALAAELQGIGRRLVVEFEVSDGRIAASLARARCLAFPSLHEGFGLPVVEALSQAVPVITSDFGSMREAAAHHGGLLVDPRDVFALAAALREVLTDDELHARLVAEAAARPVRTWVEYADELWEALLS